MHGSLAPAGLLLGLLLAGLLLAGCTAEGLARRDALNALVGESEAEVVRRLGPPADHWNDGRRRTLVYGEERFTLLSIGYPVATPRAVIGHVCETRAGRGRRPGGRLGVAGRRLRALRPTV